MFFTGLGTAVPAKRYSQRECWEALRRSPHYATLGAPGRALIDRVLLGEHGVRTRHLALDDLRDGLEIDPDVLYQRFLLNAPDLATRAARKALTEAGLRPQDMDAVLISTCTGYLCPGLTSYVGERLGLRPDVLALDLVGQGCGAALPNLRTADALAARLVRARAVDLRRGVQRRAIRRQRSRRAGERVPLWRWCRRSRQFKSFLQ